jgi:hypothetical protein
VVGLGLFASDKETVQAALILQHLETLWRLEAHLGRHANPGR